MNLTTARQTTLDWMLERIKDPAWEEHIKHRVMELTMDESGLFTGIAKDLKSAMRKSSEEAKKAGG